MSHLHIADQARRVTRRAKHVLRRYSPSGRSWHRASSLMSNLVPASVAVDVGASHFPHRRWQTFLAAPRCHWILIDPNSTALSYVAAWGHRSSAEAKAVGIAGESGTFTLHRTAVDSGSSLLAPRLSESMKRRYGASGQDYFFPMTRISVDCVSLLDLLVERPQSTPIILKLDTQGTELSILEGVRRLLGNQIVLVESEATLLAEPVYDGAGKLWEIQSLMESSGYELAYLEVIYRKSGTKRSSSAEIPHEADAAFLLRPDVAAGLPIQFRQTLLAAYIDYGLVDDALILLGEDPELRQILGPDIQGVKSALLALAD